MRKILIFGNSGSGKSTLAQRLSRESNLPHLDLDTLAWLPWDPAGDTPPQRMPLEESLAAMQAFTAGSEGWVIEGCYADLLERMLPHATEIVFMNLPAEACVANARLRPWEPHKYPSKEAQDANLPMLIEWIRQYDERTDTFSRAAHQALYDAFAGHKSMRTSNL